MRTRTKWVCMLAAAVVAAACGSNAGGSTASKPAGPPQHGGSITVLESSSFTGSWPSGLDPATNTTGGGNISQNEAIFGGLFELRANDDGTNAQVVPNQAESYQILDGGTTIRINLRPA